jgi:hypothetical protein
MHTGADRVKELLVGRRPVEGRVPARVPARVPELGTTQAATAVDGGSVS